MCQSSHTPVFLCIWVQSPRTPVFLCIWVQSPRTPVYLCIWVQSPHTPVILCIWVQSPHTPVILCIWVADYIKQGHVLTTTCDFKRGGAKKRIMESIWNNSEKNHLDLYQVQKRLNVKHFPNTQKCKHCFTLCTRMHAEICSKWLYLSCWPYYKGHMLTTTCDFGGAKKPTVGIEVAEKTAKRIALRYRNISMGFCWSFFSKIQTQRHCFLPLCIHAQGNKSAIRNWCLEQDIICV